MKNFLLLWALLLMTCGQLFPQSALPVAWEITSDTASSQVPGNLFWQQLEDNQDKWTLADVSRQPLAAKFHAPGIKPTSIDTSHNQTYWVRYRLKNTMDREANISLFAAVDYYTVYIIKNDTLIGQYQTGLLQPWDKKDGLKAAYYAGAIPLTLEPGEEILVYDRRQKKGADNFTNAPKIYSTVKLIREQYIDYVEKRNYYFGKINLQEAFLLGLLSLAIFLNGLFYRIVKEKVYLYFSLFALFLGINRLWNISNMYARWEHPGWLQFVPLLGYAWAFIPLFLIQFFRQFLKTKMVYPRWDKLLLLAGWLNVLLVILSFLSQLFMRRLSHNFSGAYSFLSFFFIPLCIVITLLLYTRQKEKTVRYVIIGSFPFLLLYLLISPQQVFGVQVKFINALIASFRLIEVVCISWLVLSFSLILMMRFDRLRKENTEKALENEQLGREKEREKNELIEKQKAELEVQVAQRTADLQQSIADLKSAQSQLIQAEKMASLGQLTAGIAHEIQNPLNFVNNFSEVNTEILEELRTERAKPISERDEQTQDEIISDLMANEQKINHHGKRAGAIVKGMLQHSRVSGGTKEPTDINKLADEYLRLAYHGIRAKDNSFNARLKTDFDETIGNINIVQQDIGRVILNLIVNALYVVCEKKKSGIENYEPTVSMITKKINNKIEIKVADNGNGIPPNIIDKIFQPFFTTKPTGQGTGLGLSLAYDIIITHGGELKVETIQNGGTTFIVSLPA